MAKVFILTLIGASIIFSVQCENSDWRILHMHFTAPDKLATDPYAFILQPNERKSAKSQGFTKMSSNANYLGDRYMKGNDSSAILIFGVTGRLVGEQTQFPDSEITSDTWRQWFVDQSMFTQETRDGKLYYVLTAYTIEPSDIGKADQEHSCPKADGCGLWIQQTQKDSKTYWKAPQNVKDILAANNKGAKWIRGKCINGMGTHYQWNTTVNMSCTDIKPFFLVYINDSLTALGWQVFGDFSSTMLEIVPKNAGGIFFYQAPVCLKQPVVAEAKGIRTLHTYFNIDPRHYVCSARDKQEVV